MTIMITKKLNSQEFLEEMLEDLKLKGFDVSEESNITSILSSIISTNTKNINDINSIISKLSFDGRSGVLLDELYGFFGIPRMIKNVKDISFSFLNNGTNSITLNPNVLIEYSGKVYRVTTKQYINPNELKDIYAVPTEDLFINDLFVSIKNCKLFIKNIDVENTNDSNKSDYIERNFILSNVNMNLDKETDLEYKSRAQGLIQHFGDSNITKIKNYVMGIDYVSDVKIDKNFTSIIITAIPTEIKYLNQINEQIKEATDYFSSSRVIVSNPSITEFKVTGLTEQLIEWGGTVSNSIGKYLIGIKKYLDEYAKDLFLNKATVVNRDTIEFTINKYFSDNDIIFTVDEKRLNVSYSIYTEENYIEPIIVNSIERRGSKDIKTDLVIFGEVV